MDSRFTGDWDLWTYPQPIQKGPLLTPLSEVWKDGKLQSKKPAVLRSCVAQVAKRAGGGREAVSKAFAICTASLQRSGKIRHGSVKLTKSGKGNAISRGKDGSTRFKDQAYERIVAAARAAQ